MRLSMWWLLSDPASSIRVVDIPFLRLPQASDSCPSLRWTQFSFSISTVSLYTLIRKLINTHSKDVNYVESLSHAGSITINFFHRLSMYMIDGCQWPQKHVRSASTQIHWYYCPSYTSFSLIHSKNHWRDRKYCTHYSNITKAGGFSNMQ